MSWRSTNGYHLCLLCLLRWVFWTKSSSSFALFLSFGAHLLQHFYTWGCFKTLTSECVPLTPELWLLRLLRCFWVHSFSSRLNSSWGFAMLAMLKCNQTSFFSQKFRFLFKIRQFSKNKIDYLRSSSME